MQDARSFAICIISRIFHYKRVKVTLSFAKVRHDSGINSESTNTGLFSIFFWIAYPELTHTFQNIPIISEPPMCSPTKIKIPFRIDQSSSVILLTGTIGTHSCWSLKFVR